MTLGARRVLYFFPDVNASRMFGHELVHPLLEHLLPVPGDKLIRKGEWKPCKMPIQIFEPEQILYKIS